jgi:hypothetical protein
MSPFPIVLYPSCLIFIYRDVHQVRNSFTPPIKCTITNLLNSCWSCTNHPCIQLPGPYQLPSALTAPTAHSSQFRFSADAIVVCIAVRRECLIGYGSGEEGIFGREAGRLKEVKNKLDADAEPESTRPSEVYQLHVYIFAGKHMDEWIHGASHKSHPSHNFQ